MMNGLLGTSWDDQRTMAALQMAGGLLAAAGPSRSPTNLGMGLLGGLQAYQQSMGDARKQKTMEEELALRKTLADAQIKNYEAEAQARQTAAELKRQELERERARQQFLMGAVAPVGQMGAMPGSPTQANADSVGRTAQLGPDFYRQAIALGIPVEQIKAIADAQNFGRQRVANWGKERTAEGVREIGRDDFGAVVPGATRNPFIEPKLMNLGDRQVAYDPTQITSGQAFNVGVSPDTRYSGGITMRGQNMTDARARDANILAAAGNSVKGETDLRKEFVDLPQVKSYTAGFRAYAAIRDAVTRDTPQSDINLVYGAAKLYDPESVVREGEYATIANSQAIPERIKGMANHLAGGGRLTAETRRQLMQEADSRIAILRGEYDKAQGSYSEIATRRGLNPANVFPSVGEQVRAQTQARPLPPNPTAKSLEKGAVYETKKGPLRWNGLAFEDL